MDEESEIDWREGRQPSACSPDCQGGLRLGNVFAPKSTFNLPCCVWKPRGQVWGARLERAFENGGCLCGGGKNNRSVVDAVHDF